MVNWDNPQWAGFLVILVALLGPVIYSFFIDKHKKGTPDPRKVKF